MPHSPPLLCPRPPSTLSRRRRAFQASQVLPKLAAGGIIVWRWPGGAIGDAWCPTTSRDTSADACFERFPALRSMGHDYTPPTFLALGDFIAQCALHSCVPILQINAAIALIYGADAASGLTADILADFAAAGIHVRHLEFGNEVRTELPAQLCP